MYSEDAASSKCSFGSDTSMQLHTSSGAELDSYSEHSTSSDDPEDRLSDLSW